MNQDAQRILTETLREALPGAAVGQALDQISFNPDGRLVVVAAGKAAWEMARAAVERIARPIAAGVVVTKYDHARGPLDWKFSRPGIPCRMKTATAPPPARWRR